MAITKIEMKNITVFDSLSVDFIPGINVLIGENGTGKTHIMKLLYSACKAAKHDVSFAHKTVRVFRPEESCIRRLVNRKNKGGTAAVKVFSENCAIGMSFTNKTPKWEAKVTKEAEWEKQSSTLEATFIPAKEILSNAYNLTEAASRGNVDFDDTYIDLIASAKVDISTGNDSNDKKQYISMLQTINKGRVAVEQDRFYLKPGSNAKLEFNLVAEGIRKIGLLWQLIKNGTMEKGSVLFWDEPEANINPIHIPVLVDMLVMLQNSGVQIFISTHDYIFAKYIELKGKENVMFYSLYSNEKDGEIVCENNAKFGQLKNNKIEEGFNALLDEIYKAEVKL